MRIALRREYDLHALPGRVLFRTRLETPGGVEEGAWPLVPVRRDELAAWLAGAGFTGMDFFGDYDRGMFVPASSPALVAVASIPG